MQIGFVKPEADRRGFVVRVVEVNVSDLQFSNGGYRLAKRTYETLASYRHVPTIEQANTKLTVLCKRHGAVLLTDRFGIEEAIASFRKEKDSDVIVQSALTESLEEKSEPELDIELLEFGFTARQLDSIDYRNKLRIYRDRLGPDQVFRPDGRLRLRRRSVIDDAAEDKIRCYEVFVSHRLWPLGLNSAKRKYSLGVTVDREEADRIASKWEAENYSVEVVALGKHHKAKSVVKHTLWGGDTYNPICCSFPSCGWVGDNLGGHLRSHGTTVAAYRLLFDYGGEAFVGRSSVILESTHKGVKARNEVKVGMYTVLVSGMSDATVYRLVSIKGNQYTFDPMGIGDQIVLTAEQMLKRMRPVGFWTRRLKKKLLGGEA